MKFKDVSSVSKIHFLLKTQHTNIYNIIFIELNYTAADYRNEVRALMGSEQEQISEELKMKMNKYLLDNITYVAQIPN